MDQIFLFLGNLQFDSQSNIADDSMTIAIFTEVDIIDRLNIIEQL